MKVEIPMFREVYFRKFNPNDDPETRLIKTVCELHDVESGDVLAFGVSKVTGDEHYNKTTGMMLAFASAMKHFFIREMVEEPEVEDNIK